jgi:GntR family transcriptional regulator
MDKNTSASEVLSSSVLPLYRQVEDLILEDVSSGILKEGDLIPSEIELARRYGVHQGTVRKAILNLTQKGILYRKQGKGTFVVFHRNNVKRYRNYRFVNAPHTEFSHLSIALIDLRTIQASHETAEHLQIKKGSQVIQLERIGKVGDDSFLHTISYLPKRLYPGLEKYSATDFVKNTLWKLQEIYFKIRVRSREEFVSAVAADSETARLLETQAGDPILRIRMIATCETGEIVEYRISQCKLASLEFYVSHVQF